MLKEGDIIPTNIGIINAEEQEVTLKNFLGGYTLVYFYPEDNTPGCTTEACDFRDFNSKLKDLGVTVLGISTDSQKSHAKFTKKYSLNFPLLSDPDHKLMEAFGNWQLKKLFGREYMGTVRSTFFIDPEGKVVQSWEKVHADSHVEEVYNFIQTYFKK